MKYLLGVDFGGGASKATLLDERGQIVCTATSEYPMLYPNNGWAEQEPESIYQAFVRNVKSILGRSGVSAEEIAALSLDGGTHIAVLLDEKNEVIRPAIYWSDTRSAQQAGALKEHSEAIMKLSMNSPSAIWTLPQLMWLRETEPENYKRIAHILFLKDYIRFRITGDMVTDSIEAMGAMLLDANTGEWNPWLCGLCGIRVDQLPEIREPVDIIGTPLRAVCQETGLSPHTQVCAGATDTVMEVYASGAVRPGQMTLKLATAGRICPITDHAIVDPLLVCYRHVIPGLWYPGTATKTCASSMRWYRDVLGGGSKSPLWRQIVADVLNIPLCQSLTDDSSVGSAMLAGVACGVFSSFEESVAVCSRTGGLVEPNPANRQKYDDYFGIYRRVHDALEGIYHDLNR